MSKSKAGSYKATKSPEFVPPIDGEMLIAQGRVTLSSSPLSLALAPALSLRLPLPPSLSLSCFISPLHMVSWTNVPIGAVSNRSFSKTKQHVGKLEVSLDCASALRVDNYVGKTSLVENVNRSVTFLPGLCFFCLVLHPQCCAARVLVTDVY